MVINMSHFEKQLSTRSIYDGRIVHLRTDTVELENGEQTLREVIDHPGGVGIVALDREDNVLLVRQFRYPFSQELLEIPAGKLERGEDHYVCGLRELQEETGYSAKTFQYLGCLYPTPAYLTEITHLYYARDLTAGGQKLDEDEFLSVLRLPFAQAVQMVLDGGIPDAKTQIGLLRVDALHRQGKL